MKKNSLTPNQVVAANLRSARVLRGWTQEEAAERLEPYLGERWSRVVYSAAERSLSGKRIRQFDADEILALAAAFKVPVAWFFRPAPQWGEEVAAPGAEHAMAPDELDEIARGDLAAAEGELWDEYQQRIDAKARAEIGERPRERKEES